MKTEKLDEQVGVDAPSFSYKGVTYLHTSKPWQSKTNRHTTTSGHDWGWIEGPEDHITWSNCPSDRGLTRADASKVVGIHNAWLESQKPLAVRLADAHAALRRAKAEYEHTSARHIEAVAKYRDAIDAVKALKESEVRQ